MARDNSPPFGRGETFYQGRTIDSTNYGGLNLEGQIREFEDEVWTGGTGSRQTRSNRIVRCMIVRNVSAVAILPGQLVTFQVGGTDGRYMLGRVDGLATADSVNAYPADEWLPASGVPVGDLFWIVIEGPASVYTALDGGTDNVINVGTALVALTAATSGATAAGRVVPQIAGAATTGTVNEVYNRIGYALSAATTANTNALILMDVRRW